MKIICLVATIVCLIPGGRSQELPLCVDYSLSAAEEFQVEELDLRICNCTDSLWVPGSYHIKSLRFPYFYDERIRQILLTHPELERLEPGFSGMSLSELKNVALPNLRFADLTGLVIERVEDYGVLRKYEKLETILIDADALNPATESYLSEMLPEARLVAHGRHYPSLYTREAEMMKYFELLEYPFSFRGRFSIKLQVDEYGRVQSIEEMNKATKKKLDPMDRMILKNFLIFKNDPQRQKDVILTMKVRN